MRTKETIIVEELRQFGVNMEYTVTKKGITSIKYEGPNGVKSTAKLHGKFGSQQVYLGQDVLIELSQEGNLQRILDKSGFTIKIEPNATTETSGKLDFQHI